MMLSFGDVVSARDRISTGVLHTPCRESIALSERTDSHVVCKLEYLQRTGSFKERGARNALLQLSAGQRQGGVVAASAGNHALALAYHGRDLGIPVTVVMPFVAPLVKQSRCRELGAEVVLFGANIGEAKERADEYSAKGATYIHGFDDLAVIAGAGTVGLEMLEQAPDLEAIVVPVGGAGLIAGIGLVAKHLNPGIQIIGVEPAAAPSYLRAWQVGDPVLADVGATLADGLAVPMVGKNAFHIASKVVDRVVTVDEASIALAILRLLELEKGVVEGAGAIGLAALLSGRLPELQGKKVGLVLCGGNIDPAVLGRVIEMGLVADGRLAQFTATISDRPGGLAAFTRTLADLGVSIKQITHERAFGGADVSKVEVRCTIETRDRNHLTEVLAALDL